LFADDTLIEFRRIEDFIKWEKERKKAWLSFGMKLNPEKTLLLTADKELLSTGSVYADGSTF
jgi:hypothetical protein